MAWSMIVSQTYWQESEIYFATIGISSYGALEHVPPYKYLFFSVHFELYNIWQLPA